MIGQTISHYRIIEMLGGGGMGVVYKAEDLYLGRDVALKFLPENLTSSKEALDRFRREAQAASALNHPHICTIYDFLIHDGKQVIVMEWVNGKTLEAFVSGGNLPARSILELAIQVTEALNAAHSVGVVHRDIKPQNILVSEQGNAKLLDFGLAKIMPAFDQRANDPAQAATRAYPHRLTIEGSTLGTVSYMSPEQALGRDVDARSDIFSLGVVLYELWTGSLPFSGQTLAAQFNSLLNQSPLQPDRIRAMPSPHLSRITLKALEKNRNDRYQSSRELLDALKQARDLIDSNGMLGKWAGLRRVSGSIARAPGWTFVALDRAVRKKKIRTAVLLAAAFFILALWLGPPLRRQLTVEYYSGIALTELSVDSKTIPQGLIEFLISKCLKHYGRDLSDLRVWTDREFETLVSQRWVVYGSGMPEEASSWPGWLLPKQELAPGVRVSGRAVEGVGNLELSLVVDRRGTKRSLRRSYGSVDEFLSAGVAEISIDLLRDFGVDRAPAGPFTGPQADLPLSGDWEAIRHFYLGHEAMTRLDRTIAERELTSALEIDPEFALARIELADLRVNQLRWEDAKVQALEATRFAPNLERVDRLRLEAILARIDQNITLERSILRKMIGLQPQKKEFLFALAESFFHTADADLASIRFQQVLELDPDFALAHNHLGYCYSWKGEHDAAIASLERYLQLDGTANAYDSLGHGLMAAGKYDEARAAFQRSIDLDSSLEFTKYGLAFVEILQGRFQTAQNLLGQFIAESRSPQESGLYLYALGYLYLQLQDPEQALKACNQGLAGFPEETVDPTYQDLVWLKGLVLLEKDDRTGAQAQLAKLQRAVNRDGVTATKYQPVLKYSLHLEAMIAATAGQLAACSEAIGRLLHLEEKMGYWGAPLDRSYFLDSAGCLYERLRLKRDAEALYRSALSYNGNYAISRFHLGKLLMEQNREREAAPYLRSFLDSWGEADRDMREVQEAGTLLGLASRGAD